MNLCNETITVFNAKLNPETGNDDYNGTVIDGVSWFCEIVSTVDQGLKAANKFTIRIPEDADFGFTVLGVTDNRRAPNAPHWKVIGT